MGQRKPYNINTAYGRKKLREQSEQHYNKLPTEEKKEWDLLKWVILLAICLVAYLLLGTDGFLKWAGR